MDHDTERLVKSILEWWEDAHFLTTGEHDDINLFDEQPEFVTIAWGLNVAMLEAEMDQCMSSAEEDIPKTDFMRCKKCGLTNLVIVKSGPHNKLVCTEPDCLAFQKFLNEVDTKSFLQLQAKPKEVTS